MNQCEFCMMEGIVRATAGDGLASDAHVCDKCWKLLQDPVTALPLLRGHLTLQLRGTMSPDKLEKALNAYMEMISKWKPRQ